MSEKIGFTEQYKMSDEPTWSFQIQQPTKICVKCSVNLSMVDGWIAIKGDHFCGDCLKKVFMMYTDGGKDENS